MCYGTWGRKQSDMTDRLHFLSTLLSLDPRAILQCYSLLPLLDLNLLSRRQPQLKKPPSQTEAPNLTSEPPTVGEEQAIRECCLTLLCFGFFIYRTELSIVPALKAVVKTKMKWCM